MRSPTGGRDAGSRARPDRGQSTVEFALVLPLLVAFLVLLFQVAVVVRDQILVVHAARDAAREAAVTHDLGRVRRAATRTLPGASVRVVRRGAPGDTVEVLVSYVAPTDLPLVGALLPDVTLRSDAVMRVERP
jgi:hypothetical protein